MQFVHVSRYLLDKPEQFTRTFRFCITINTCISVFWYVCAFSEMLTFKEFGVMVFELLLSIQITHCLNSRCHWLLLKKRIGKLSRSRMHTINICIEFLKTFHFQFIP